MARAPRRRVGHLLLRRRQALAHKRHERVLRKADVLGLGAHARDLRAGEAEPLGARGHDDLALLHVEGLDDAPRGRPLSAALGAFCAVMGAVVAEVDLHHVDHARERVALDASLGEGARVVRKARVAFEKLLREGEPPLVGGRPHLHAQRVLVELAAARGRHDLGGAADAVRLRQADDVRQARERGLPRMREARLHAPKHDAIRERREVGAGRYGRGREKRRTSEACTSRAAGVAARRRQSSMAPSSFSRGYGSDETKVLAWRVLERPLTCQRERLKHRPRTIRRSRAQSSAIERTPRRARPPTC